MTMDKIGANIFVETVYPGVNVGCVVTDEGAICIDTPLLPGEAQRWRARIRSLGGKNVCCVVYTSGQSERVLGTQYLLFDQQGSPIEQPLPDRRVLRPRRVPFQRPATQVSPAKRKSIRKGAVVAHKSTWEQVKEHRTDSFRQSMVDTLGDRDPDMINLQVILPQITFDTHIELFAGDVTATLLAVAKGALWVWLPEQQVLFVGDTVVVGVHPPLTVIDVHEWLAALEQLQQKPQFQDAVLVPGRGPLCDISATEPLTEYLHTASKLTLEVYRAGRPKADLNGVAAELVPLCPVPDGQWERVQRQIKLGLDEIYDGFKAADVAVG